MVYSGPLAEINKRLIFAPRRVWLLIQKPETNKMWTSPCLLVMLCKFVFTHCKNNKFLTKIIMFWNWHSKTSYNTATTILSSGKAKRIYVKFLLCWVYVLRCNLSTWSPWRLMKTPLHKCSHNIPGMSEPLGIFICTHRGSVLTFVLYVCIVAPGPQLFVFIAFFTITTHVWQK